VTAERAIAEARLKSLRAEVLRGLAMAAVRQSEELRDETRAMRAAIKQRRLLDSRRLGRMAATPRTPAPR
jgi:hypothetical protein